MSMALVPLATPLPVAMALAAMEPMAATRHSCKAMAPWQLTHCSRKRLATRAALLLIVAAMAAVQ